MNNLNLGQRVKNLTKKVITRFPIISRYLLGIFLFGAALFLGGMINKGALKDYFPYTPVLLLLLATWLLYRLDKQSLKSIGLTITRKHIFLLAFGVLIGAVAFLGSKYISALYLDETITLRNSVNISAILLSLYYILPQVATEEFLFRGYLFKKTISTTNVVIANVIFSIIFMLIHVLDENVLQNRGMIILLAVSIPVGHLLFATALLKSKTLFFPIGIHLGNNWATRHLISTSSEADSIFLLSNVVTFDTWPPFIMMLLLTNGFFLLVTLVIWKWDVLLGYLKR